MLRRVCRAEFARHVAARDASSFRLARGGYLCCRRLASSSQSPSLRHKLSKGRSEFNNQKSRSSPAKRSSKDVDEREVYDSDHGAVSHDNYDGISMHFQINEHGMLIESGFGSTDSTKQSSPGISLRERLRHAAISSVPEHEPGRRSNADDEPAEAHEVSTKPARSAGGITSDETLHKPRATTKPPRGPRRKDEEEPEVQLLTPRQLELTPIEDENPIPIPQLSHGLDRVLFNPGVYSMQDKRSGVFNFDPYLASIMPAEEFDFDALSEYITSSKDAKLQGLAAKYGKKYMGSTSSMTAILSHLHFLISGWRRPNYGAVSQSVTLESDNFTMLTRTPVATYLRYSNGTYAIDADKEFDTASILSKLGKSMEKLLTLPKEEFEKYRLTKSHQLTEEEKNAEEAYHYTTMGDFLMRSQLDAHDSRLPGEGVFDLKTRAVVSVRMNVHGYKTGAGYQIRKLHGQWESFDREYCDMIRSAFLKYSLQVRMGRMDGIFVAYHNTQHIFGFQYIGLEEMDEAIHGTRDLEVGNGEFKASLSLLNELLDRATKKFPEQSLRLHVETRDNKIPVMYFVAQPVSEQQMEAAEKANVDSAKDLENQVRDLSQKEQEAESAADADDVSAEEQSSEEPSDASGLVTQSSSSKADPTWDEMIAKVEEYIDAETGGLGSFRSVVQDGLDRSGLLDNKSPQASERYVDALVAALSANINPRAPSLDPATSESDAALVDDAALTHDQSVKDVIVKMTQAFEGRTGTIDDFKELLGELAFAAQEAKAPSAADNDVEKEKEAADGGAESVNSGTVEDGGEGIEAEDPSTPKEEGEVMGMYVTVRNKVNGNYVCQVNDGEETKDWDMEYIIGDMHPERARRVLRSLKNRRRKVFQQDEDDRANSWRKMWGGQLAQYTRKGTAHRQDWDNEQKGKSVYVAWDQQPLPLSEKEPGATDAP